VVRTEVGYHIIKLQDKRESFDDLEDKVISMIKEQAYFEYVQSLRDEATIKTYLD
jgi:parvulin-like peptidyl-prolyl isomerase